MKYLELFGAWLKTYTPFIPVHSRMAASWMGGRPWTPWHSRLGAPDSWGPAAFVSFDARLVVTRRYSDGRVEESQIELEAITITNQMQELANNPGTRVRITIESDSSSKPDSPDGSLTGLRRG